MKHPLRVKVFINTDGAAGPPNPGPAGAGYVIVNEDLTNEDWGPVLGAVPLGWCTHHEAEYEAALRALTVAADMGANAALLRADSLLMVRQMQGLFAVKALNLIPLAAKMRDQIERYDEVVFKWVPRKQNKAADWLSKVALGRNAREDLAGPRRGSES